MFGKLLKTGQPGAFSAIIPKPTFPVCQVNITYIIGINEKGLNALLSKRN
jgi:hypothetical protein